MRWFKQKIFVLVAVAFLVTGVSIARAQSTSASGQDCWASEADMINAPSNMANFDKPLCSDLKKNSSSQPTQTSQQAESGKPADAQSLASFGTAPTPIEKLISADQSFLAQFDKSSSSQSPSLNVPTLNQNDPANGALGSEACGPTALAMVAKFYGIDASVPTLMQDVGTTGSGSVLSNLATVAQQIGLTGTVMGGGSFIGNLVDAFTGGSSSFSAVSDAISSGNPVIVNVDLSGYSGGHAMVVTGISGGEVYVNNPWNGQQEAYGQDQFMSMWGATGYGYVIPKP